MVAVALKAAAQPLRLGRVDPDRDREIRPESLSRGADPFDDDAFGWLDLAPVAETVTLPVRAPETRAPALASGTSSSVSMRCHQSSGSSQLAKSSVCTTGAPPSAALSAADSVVLPAPPRPSMATIFVRTPAGGGAATSCAAITSTALALDSSGGST